VSVSDTWQQGDPYERYIGRWSRLVAPRFLDWLDLGAGRRWVDVGCGTGALTAAIVERCDPAVVVGVEPSQGFLDLAAARLRDRATLALGNATSIPLPEGSADAVVSGLVLNFAPDPAAGLREMARVAARGGVVAAYVWDYAEGMQLIRRFWDVATSLDPAAAPLDEGTRFPICRPDALAGAFEGAGLRDVATAALEVETRFADFDDYWHPFLGGQGPAPSYVSSLAPARREALHDALRATLASGDDGSIALRARAWAVRGRSA
jgi:SAM-dependent methyltransferase